MAVCAAAAFTLAALAAPVPDAHAQAVDRSHRYDAYINEAATLYTLPADFIRAVIRVESNFDPSCVSRVGARGLMQLMPGTAASMGVVHVHDPRENILGGSRYLRILANSYDGNYPLTLAAYNAGEGRVARYLSGSRPLPEITVTRYIPSVLRWFRRYLAH